MFFFFLSMFHVSAYICQSAVPFVFCLLRTWLSPALEGCPMIVGLEDHLVASLHWPQLILVKPSYVQWLGGRLPCLPAICPGHMNQERDCFYCQKKIRTAKIQKSSFFLRQTWQQLVFFFFTVCQFLFLEHTNLLFFVFFWECYQVHSYPVPACQSHCNEVRTVSAELFVHAWEWCGVFFLLFLLSHLTHSI